MNNNDNVADYYEGKSIFITGGTGFLGKVIIEKLLYSCPGLDKIYVLVRNRDQRLSADQKINNLINSPLFTRVKNERPSDLSKLVPVCGDVSLPNLGISAQDEQKLVEKVSIVIHMAASIKFNEPLKQALVVNLEGTRKMLHLCHRMEKLEQNGQLQAGQVVLRVFIHTSTAYTNTDKKVVEEQVYPPPANLDDVYEFIKRNDHEDCGQRKKILNGHRNTYTFTKSLAETLIKEQHGNIPTIIIRPSVITAMLGDPLPGWISHWYGAPGLVTSFSKGLTRIIYGSSQTILDLIPVDYVSNLIIAVAAKTERSESVIVYNSCSSDCNEVSLGDFLGQFTELHMEKETYVAPRPDLCIITRCYWLVLLVSFLFQTLPAYILDFCLLLRRKHTRYVKLQNLMTLNRDALSFFTSNSWTMKTRRARALAASLSPADARQFPFNPKDINWREYFPIYWAGIRRFLEKRS